MAQWLNRQAGVWTDANFNGLNENWTKIESTFSEYDAKIQQAVDKAVSAYEEWLAAGNKGTVDDFFESLKGDTVPASEVAPLLQPYVDQQVADTFSKLTAQQQQDAEVILARDTFASLDARLDNIQEASANTGNPVDFVSKLKQLTAYQEMHLRKIDARMFAVSNYNIYTKRHITHVFNKNANDDYIIKSETYVGGTSQSEFFQEYKNYTAVSGAFNTTYDTHFTTEVGAKIKADVTGSVIYLNRYGDTRGGVWKFTLDNDANKTVTVSTYKATAGTDTFKLFDNLTNTLHTVTAEFLGADPNNAPSDNIARGWLPYSSDGVKAHTFKMMFYNMNFLRDNTIEMAQSNKDIALRMKENGTTEAEFYFPEHNATGTAFNIEAPKIYLDDVLVDVFAMQAGITKKGYNFSLVQSVYCKSPNTQKQLLNYYSIHDLSLDNVCRIIGKMIPLVAIDIIDGYFGMLPVDTETATRLTTAIQNEYNTKIYDGSRTTLTKEKDTTGSMIFTSDVNKNLFAAITYNDKNYTLRTGQAGKFPTGQTAWIEHRNADMQKLYQSVFRNYTAQAGEAFKLDISLISGEIVNIYNVI